MAKRKLGRTPPVARDVNGVATQYLISYLRDFEPEGTLQRVLREAGETRSPKTLQSAACWSSYAQFRRLLEATASVLDGLTTLTHVSDHVFDANQSPELSGSLTSLASPADTYAMLPELMESTIPIVELQTESVSPTECRVRLRFRGDFEPFPEYCAFEISMLGTIPRVFGAPEAEVFIESCQCEGDDYCQALLRWSPIDDVAARVSNAEIRRQLAESRLRGLQRTLADLVSGDDLQTVLTRVVESVASAVPARQYILDIDAGASRARMLCAIGIDEAEGTRKADNLLHGLLDNEPRATARTALPETPRHIHLTAVASDKKRYGTLVSIRSEAMTFQPAERSIFESYARLAASALDSENAILEARQQTTSAQVLLALSASLSELASTDEMATRIAQAVPFVVNCDRVVVWLIDPGDSFGRAVATYGFGRATEAEWRTLTVAIPPPTVIPQLAFHHVLEPGRAAFSDLLAASGSKAAVSFPILYDGEPYGWITVDVTDHPERLDDDIEITERLRALGGQAAVAIRNGRLLGEIRHQALHDSLTGLPNRVLVLDRISQTLSRARPRAHRRGGAVHRPRRPEGHQRHAGPCHGGQVAPSGRRPVLPARCAKPTPWPGSAATSSSCWPTGSRWRPAPNRWPSVCSRSWPSPSASGANGHVRISISASIGIASGLRDTAEELLRDADIAMYAAKGSGKNCFAVFETEMHRERRGRHELEADLQAAIGTDQFFLAYQPIFDLTTMAVVGVEALLRWQHPVRGLLQPDEFIPALETSGLIIPVGRWVLHEACRQAMEWRADGDTTRMSVNASARQLDTSSLVDDVSHALAATGLPADDLIVEITETGLMRDAKGAQEQLVALKALGVRIAIDDFGTGYSSLAYLQQFPIDTLKIDRTFIAGMRDSPEGSALIHTFMQLGQALHLETLAEGIEEDAQLSQLQAERCHLGQGYLLARPLTPEGVKEMFVVERAAY